MIASVVDYTTEFNANNGIKVDVANWQNVVIHVSGTISGTVNVTGTNDGGAITGATSNSPTSSLNYTAIQIINMATAAAVTAISAAGNYKVIYPTQYIQIGGASAATTGKVILFLTTPV